MSGGSPLAEDELERPPHDGINLPVVGRLAPPVNLGQLLAHERVKLVLAAVESVSKPGVSDARRVIADARNAGRRGFDSG